MSEDDDHTSNRLSRVLVLAAMIILLVGTGGPVVKVLAFIIGSIAAVLLVLDK